MPEAKSQGVPPVSGIKKPSYICMRQLKIVSKKFQKTLESFPFPLYCILTEEFFLFPAHFAGFPVPLFPVYANQ